MSVSWVHTMDVDTRGTPRSCHTEPPKQCHQMEAESIRASAPDHTLLEAELIPAAPLSPETGSPPHPQSPGDVSSALESGGPSRSEPRPRLLWKPEPCTRRLRVACGAGQRSRDLWDPGVFDERLPREEPPSERRLSTWFLPRSALSSHAMPRARQDGRSPQGALGGSPRSARDVGQVPGRGPAASLKHTCALSRGVSAALTPSSW